MRSIVINWRAWLWILSDHLRTIASKFAPYALSPTRRICFAIGARTVALRLTMLEHRLTYSESLTSEIRARLPDILSRLTALMDPPDRNLNLLRRRVLILQPPIMSETAVNKGVLVITFTETFRFFAHYINTERLLRYFRVVLEPSWSGYCLPEILLWSQYDQPVIVQSSEPRDRHFLEQLRTCLVPISIGASDWVDHRIFYPTGQSKEFDVIYIANLSPIKRVHVFLRAVRILLSRRSSSRAALVLSSWGGSRGTFEQLLDLYRLRDRINVFMNLSQRDLNEILNRSKVSVLLSKKEGSNRTLFESMFANVPVLLLHNNIGVNKEYINEQTGLLISEKELPDAIERIGNMSPPLSPRSWAMENIAPEITTLKLQSLLQAQQSPDDVSSAPLWVKVNSPEATYMDRTLCTQVPDIAELLNCFTRHTSMGECDQTIHARLRVLFSSAEPSRAQVPSDPIK